MTLIEMTPLSQILFQNPVDIYSLERLHLLFRFYAGVAQLVERNLAKVEVASSNLVARSISGAND